MNRWLTPDTPSGVTVRRVLHIPLELLTSVNGALEQLAEVYNWEQYGTLTPDETAALVRTMLEGYYVDIVGDDILGRRHIVPLWAPSTSTNTWQWLSNTLSNNGGYWKSADTATINQYVEFKLQLAPGNYKIKTLVTMNSASGDVRVQIDGNTILNMSLYSATAQHNLERLSDQFTITVGGEHTLHYEVFQKQSGSSGYRMYLSGIHVEWQP